MEAEIEQLYIPQNIVKMHGSPQLGEPLRALKVSLQQLNFSVRNFSRFLDTGFRGFPRSQKLSLSFFPLFLSLLFYLFYSFRLFIYFTLLFYFIFLRGIYQDLRALMKELILYSCQNFWGSFCYLMRIICIRQNFWKNVNKYNLFFQTLFYLGDWRCYSFYCFVEK